MSKYIKLKRGYDLNLKGKPQPTVSSDISADTYAIKPTDFPGIEREKSLVVEGDTVKAGTPIFMDKTMEEVKYCSPVSGEVVEVRRGAKRKLLEIVVLGDKDIDYHDHGAVSVSDLNAMSRADAQSKMLAAGVWPNIVQRPYGIVANPSDTPKSIFISGFDSHPLAPDYSVLLGEDDRMFQAGIDVLRKFTEGSIHLNIRANSEVPKIFSQINGVEVNKIRGPHPAGNVGVQIHHIDPINKGELVWTIQPFGVIQIGKLFLEGRYDASRIIALTGSEVKEPKYYRTLTGAGVKKFLDGTVDGDNARAISGNVLTGARVDMVQGHVGFYDNQLTVIPEGDYYEMFGWILPSFTKLSLHKGFGLLSFLNPRREFVVDSNTHGEPRAFVMTGAFEKVTPMDIYPTYLIKAIMAQDFDDMEALGIYEVVEEDLALCEFMDVSKHDVQSIVREGIDLMIHS